MEDPAASGLSGAGGRFVMGRQFPFQQSTVVDGLAAAGYLSQAAIDDNESYERRAASRY